jgi:hypothetical protein
LPETFLKLLKKIKRRLKWKYLNTKKRL